MEYMMSVTRAREAYHSLLWTVPAVLFFQAVDNREGREEKLVKAPTDSDIYYPSGMK